MPRRGFWGWRCWAFPWLPRGWRHFAALPYYWPYYHYYAYYERPWMWWMW